MNIRRVANMMIHRITPIMKKSRSTSEKGKIGMNRKKLICYVLIIILMGWVLMHMTMRISLAEDFAEYLKHKPQALSSRTITGFKYEEPSALTDVVINDANFEDVWFRYMEIKNVTFKNCHFKKAVFLDTSLENVTFKDCTFDKIGDQHLTRNLAHFDTTFMKNVFFDGGNFLYIYVYTKDGGNAILKNIKIKRPQGEGGNIFYGSNLDIRMDKCVIDGLSISAIDGHNKSIFHVTNSVMVNTQDQIAANLKIAWYENCRIEGGGGLAWGETVVVKDSYLDTVIGQHSKRTSDQRLFVQNCEFPLEMRYTREIGTGFGMVNNSAEVFIYGKQPRQKNVNISLHGGRYNLFDMEIDSFFMPGMDNPVELNMKNVVINGGPWKGEYPLADWEEAKIESGLWEDVTVYPEVNVKDASIKGLIIRNFSMPNGPAWVNATADTFTPLTERKVPLDIARPPVPTLEELGIVDPLKK